MYIFHFLSYRIRYCYCTKCDKRNIRLDGRINRISHDDARDDVFFIDIWGITDKLKLTGIISCWFRFPKYIAALCAFFRINEMQFILHFLISYVWVENRRKLDANGCLNMY